MKIIGRRQALTTIRQPMNRFPMAFSICLLIWYVILTGFAFACETSASTSSHHTNTSTDSPLCFFACQTASASSTALTASPQTLKNSQDSTVLYISQTFPPSPCQLLSLRSRAPPNLS